MVKKETYYFIDQAGLPDQRVTKYHRLLGKYVVRASRLIKEECQAVITCEWLNKMVEDRRKARNGSPAVGLVCHEFLFKVVRYKETNTLFVVVRKLLVDDLLSGIEELVEVKPR